MAKIITRKDFPEHVRALGENFWDDDTDEVEKAVRVARKGLYAQLEVYDTTRVGLRDMDSAHLSLNSQIQAWHISEGISFIEPSIVTAFGEPLCPTIDTIYDVYLMLAFNALNTYDVRPLMSEREFVTRLRRYKTNFIHDASRVGTVVRCLEPYMFNGRYDIAFRVKTFDEAYKLVYTVSGSPLMYVPQFLFYSYNKYVYRKDLREEHIITEYYDWIEGSAYKMYCDLCLEHMVWGEE